PVGACYKPAAPITLMAWMKFIQTKKLIDFITFGTDWPPENRFTLFGDHARASRPDMMRAAGVAELVDALDLGSSDESCGGSSPSARTKRWQAFARRFPEDLIPIRDFGSPNHWRRPQGWRRTF